jgi:hypothetical protein
MRLVMRGFGEEGSEETLAEQPPLHVDTASEYGVDLARGDRLLQFFKRQIAGHFQTPLIYGTWPESPGHVTWFTGQL